MARAVGGGLRAQPSDSFPRRMKQDVASEHDRTETPDPGLCGCCRHARLLSSRRSTFVRCGLADSDARFARYPRLPVLACQGYSPGTQVQEP